MSVKLVGLVLEHFSAKPALKLVAVILADHADQDGVCWPSYRRMAEMTSQSERQVARHVKELIELGIVTKLRSGTIIKQGSKSIRVSNAYKVNGHMIEARKTLKLSPDSLLITSEDVHLEVDKNDRSRWTPMSTKPSNNHQVNRKRRTAGDNSSRSREPESLGEVFFSLLQQQELEK